MTHCGLCRGMIGSAADWLGQVHACQCSRSVGTVWYHVVLFLLRIFIWDYLIIVDASILSLLPWLTVACAGVWLGQQHNGGVYHMPANAAVVFGTVWYHVVLFLLRIFEWMIWALVSMDCRWLCGGSSRPRPVFLELRNALVRSATWLRMSPWP